MGVIVVGSLLSKACRNERERDRRKRRTRSERRLDIAVGRGIRRKKTAHRGFVGKSMSMVTRPSWSGMLWLPSGGDIRNMGPELEALVTFCTPQKSAMNPEILQRLSRQERKRMEFPKSIDIPLDVWVDAAMDWVLMTFSGFFDFLGMVILYFMIYIEKFFLWVPWPVLVIGVGVLAWRVMGKWWVRPAHGGNACFSSARWASGNWE